MSTISASHPGNQSWRGQISKVEGAAVAFAVLIVLVRVVLVASRVAVGFCCQGANLPKALLDPVFLLWRCSCCLLVLACLCSSADPSFILNAEVKSMPSVCTSLGHGLCGWLPP